MTERFWTKERCVESAAPFTTRTAWQKACAGAYDAASREGWREECCAHMPVKKQPNGYWTTERIKADAARFETRTAWARRGGSAYILARRGPALFAECCAVMPAPQRWTHDTCLELLAACASLSNFAKKYPGAYEYAQRHGLLDDVPRQRRAPYTLNEIRARALTYTTRTKWQKGCPGSYTAAVRRGLLEECCAHMTYDHKPRGYWTLERCQAESAGYSTRAKWQAGHNASYLIASRRGWLSECTGHMVPGSTWEDGPRLVYVLLLNGANPLIKVGHAMDVAERVKDYGLASGYSVDVLLTVSAPSKIDAIRLEGAVAIEFAAARVPKRIAQKVIQDNGFTECYNTAVATDICSFVKAQA